MELNLESRQMEREWVEILCNGFRLYALKQFDIGANDPDTAEFLKNAMVKYMDGVELS